MLGAIDAHEDIFAAFDGMAVEIPQNLLPGTALRHTREAMGPRSTMCRGGGPRAISDIASADAGGGP